MRPTYKIPNPNNKKKIKCNIRPFDLFVYVYALIKYLLTTESSITKIWILFAFSFKKENCFPIKHDFGLLQVKQCGHSL